MRKPIYIVLILAGVLFVSALSANALAAGGTGPGDAIIPTGAPITIQPNSSLWFRFDYSGGKTIITVTLDDNGAAGMDFYVFTPQEVQAWQQGDTLVHIGEDNPVLGHDLGWSGRFNFPGTFYIQVTNSSAAAVTFSLNVTGESVTTVKNVIPTPTPMPNPFATPIPTGSVAGGRILFQETSGGNIDRVNADGSGLVKITTGLDPAWSPNGGQIAYVRQGTGGGLFVANADGTNERLLYSSTLEIRSPAWSPDGTRIVFTTITNSTPDKQFCFRGRCFTQQGRDIWKLREVNVGDGTVHDVVTPAGGGLSPTYNADNNMIAFVAPGQGLMVTSSDGSITPYIIAGNLNITSPAYNPLNITSPKYSPDGTHLVFMVLQQPTWQVAIANADGSNVQLVTRLDPLDFAPPNNVAPTWSPDGKQILFLSNRGGAWGFYAVNPDGTNLRQVLTNVTSQVTLNYTYNAERVADWGR